MRRTGIVLLSASLSACYSPVAGGPTETDGSDTDAPSTGDVTASSGDDASATDDGLTTTVDPDTTATSTNTDTDTDTDPSGGDAPPMFESFTVNGSTTPAEVAEGGTILLEADVSDDVGITSVEFFDGATSLGMVTDTPFELEVPVSSADSGSHTYIAIATDTAGQTTESDEVTLSVNIVGGEVLFYRESLFVSSSGLGGAGVSIMATEGGRVVVNGLIADAISGRVLAFNEDLSSLWSDNEDALVKAKAVDLGQEILISSWLDGEWNYTRRALDSSAPAGNLSVDVPAGDPVVALLGSRAVRGGDGIVLTTLPNTLRTYATNLGSPGWSSNLPASAVVSDLDPLPGGAVLLTFSDDAPCAPGSQTCLRRIEADGSVDWTVGLGSDAIAATRENEHVIAVSTRPTGGLAYAEFDGNGRPIGPELVLDAERDYVALDDVAADGVGGMVVVGTLAPSNDRTAVVSRYDHAGDLVWDQHEVANAADSMGFGVAIYEDAAFVCGIEDLTTAGLSTNGDVFAAKLRL